jgi:hypothetical protein
MSNIETILRQKIKQFADFLISICNNENKKIVINESLNNLPLYKILLFISLLVEDRFNH